MQYTLKQDIIIILLQTVKSRCRLAAMNESENLAKLVNLGRAS